jgi:hypothetical protein
MNSKPTCDKRTECHQKKGYECEFTSMPCRVGKTESYLNSTRWDV